MQIANLNFSGSLNVSILAVVAGIRIIALCCVYTTNNSELMNLSSVCSKLNGEEKLIATGPAC